MQFHISSSSSYVQAWTDTLPYCGAGKSSASQRRQPYHQQLCEAIRELNIGGSGMLQAIWTGVRGTRDPDVENLLIWDVGTALGQAGVTNFLSFERQDGPLPQLPQGVGFAARHHVRYEVVQRHNIASLNANSHVVAECEPVTCTVEDLRNTAILWKRFKQGPVRTGSGKWEPGTQFSIQLSVFAPQNVALNIADWRLVKATVDGFLSALHHYEGNQLNEVSQRIASCLSWEDAEASELLLCRENAMLGPWRVPHLKPKGLAWSPADHLLKRAEIMRQSCANGHCSIGGKLITVCPTVNVQTKGRPASDSDMTSSWIHLDEKSGKRGSAAGGGRGFGLMRDGDWEEREPNRRCHGQCD